MSFPADKDFEESTSDLLSAIYIAMARNVQVILEYAGGC
jgi:hypothetical protein